MPTPTNQMTMPPQELAAILNAAATEINNSDDGVQVNKLGVKTKDNKSVITTGTTTINGEVVKVTALGHADALTVLSGETSLDLASVSELVSTNAKAQTQIVNNLLSVGTNASPGKLEVEGSITSTSFTSSHTMSTTTVLTNLNARVIIAAHGYEISDITTNVNGDGLLNLQGEESLFHEWCLELNAKSAAGDVTLETKYNVAQAHLALFRKKYWVDNKVLPATGGDFWTQYGDILKANADAGTEPDVCARIWGSILEHIRGIPSINQLTNTGNNYRLQYEFVPADASLVGVPQRELRATASGDGTPYRESYKATAELVVEVSTAADRAAGYANTPHGACIAIPNTTASGTKRYYDDDFTPPGTEVPPANIEYQNERVSFQRGVELMISFRAARYTKSTPTGTAWSKGDTLTVGSLNYAADSIPYPSAGLLTKSPAPWVTVVPDLSDRFDPTDVSRSEAQRDLWKKISGKMIDAAAVTFFSSMADGDLSDASGMECFYNGMDYETQRGILEELAYHEFMIGTDQEIGEGKYKFAAAMAPDSSVRAESQAMIYTTTDTIKLLAVTKAKGALDAERVLRRTLVNAEEAKWKAEDVEATIAETARLAQEQLTNLSGAISNKIQEAADLRAILDANKLSQDLEWQDARQAEIEAADDAITAAEKAMIKQKDFLILIEEASVVAEAETAIVTARAAEAKGELESALADTSASVKIGSYVSETTVGSTEKINAWYEDTALFESLKLGYLQMKNLEFRNYAVDHESSAEAEGTAMFCGSAVYQYWESGYTSYFTRPYGTYMVGGSAIKVDAPPPQGTDDSVYITAEYNQAPRFSLKVNKLVGWEKGTPAERLTPYYANTTRFGSASGVKVVEADEVRLAWDNVLGVNAETQRALEKSNRIYKVTDVPHIKNYMPAAADASGSARLDETHLVTYATDATKAVGWSDDAGMLGHTVKQQTNYSTLNANFAKAVLIADESAADAFAAATAPDASGTLLKEANETQFKIDRSIRGNLSFNPSLHGVHKTGEDYVHFYTSNALRLFMNQVNDGLFNLEDYAISVGAEVDALENGIGALPQNSAGLEVRIRNIRYCDSHMAMANTTTADNNLEGMQVNGRQSGVKNGCANIGNTVGITEGDSTLFSFSWSGSHDLDGAGSVEEANASYGDASGRPAIFAPTGFSSTAFSPFSDANYAVDGPNNILETSEPVDIDTTSFGGLAYYFFDHANGWDNCAMGLGEVNGDVLTMPLSEYQKQSGRGLRTTSIYSNLPKAQFHVIDTNQVNESTSTTTSVSTSFIATSDRRLKDNIVTISNAFDIVNGLRGVAWDWKKGGAHAAGVIAQELQASPAGYAVHELAPCSELGGKEGYLSVEYNCLWGYMIEAFKEQSRRVAELQKEVLALKEK